MEKDEFKELLLQKTKNLDALLEKFLPVEEGLQKTVEEAMNYSVRAGGKRLRPMLMGETFFLCGGKEEDVRLLEPFMAALEMIHTYSLVHDDLPAMDNDMYRRGKKTTWAVYGDAFGVLAGDGLLNYAFETAAGALKACEERESLADFKKVSKALAILGKKAGIYGMIGGQTADIEAEDQKEAVTGEQLMFIHEHKTAALIEAAMMIGAVLAGAEKEKVEALEKCASNVGIAFQIQDDILDVIGDSRELGKNVGSDAQNHKQTYVTIFGLKKSKEDVAALSEEAVEILKAAGGEQGFLEQLILELIHRRK